MIKFNSGAIVATPNALDSVDQDTIMASIRRHLNGDWGDLDEYDKKVNDEALENGNRLLSAYKAEDGTKFWVITEADRSVTTVLLPEDY